MAKSVVGKWAKDKLDRLGRYLHEYTKIMRKQRWCEGFYVNFLTDGEVGWGSTEYIVLRSKDPLPLEFSYFLARDDDFRAFATANMTGSSGRQRVPAECLGQYQLVIPSKAAAMAFGKIANATMNQLAQNSTQSRGLAATRDALLPQLLSGAIRLRQAEMLVEEVL